MEMDFDIAGLDSDAATPIVPSALARIAPARGAQILTGADFARQPGERLETVFEQLAVTFAALPAVISDGRVWTYQELNSRANQFARMLIKHGVRPGHRVGLILDRSAETYVALLAVMKAGAAFVPLATAFPQERMALIIEDAGVSMIVTIAAYASRAGQLPVPHVLIDSAAAEISAESPAPLKPQAKTADDICYILYTSGSTAAPKGVTLAHGGVIANGFDIGERMHLSAADRVWLSVPLFWSFGSFRDAIMVFTCVPLALTAVWSNLAPDIEPVSDHVPVAGL